MWDERVASGYDHDARNAEGMWAPDVLDPAVDFLAALAPGGRALEFAVGTGRVALALSDRGVTVAGIDTSEAMLGVLRDKPGADRIEVVLGDMSTGTVDGQFDLVYLVYNTISNLLTQRAQVDCFRNAARHLRPGGRFVIELFVPNLRGLPPGALGQVFTIADERVGIDTYDLLNQGLVSHHVFGRRRRGQRLPLAAPLHLAVRIGPDGRAGRPDAGGAMGGLDEGAVHRGQSRPRVSLAEACLSRRSGRSPPESSARRPGAAVRRTWAVLVARFSFRRPYPHLGTATAPASSAGNCGLP